VGSAFRRICDVRIGDIDDDEDIPNPTPVTRLVSSAAIRLKPDPTTARTIALLRIQNAREARMFSD
jgi:hypothetical protein